MKKKNDEDKYDEKINIIEAIEEAREELEICREYFDLVKEPGLIDYAIYKEQAAKCRYVYLILKAKEMEIKVTDSYTFLGEASNN